MIVRYSDFISDALAKSPFIQQITPSIIALAIPSKDVDGDANKSAPSSSAAPAAASTSSAATAANLTVTPPVLQQIPKTWPTILGLCAAGLVLIGALYYGAEG